MRGRPAQIKTAEARSSARAIVLTLSRLTKVQPERQWKGAARPFCLRSFYVERRPLCVIYWRQIDAHVLLLRQFSAPVFGDQNALRSARFGGVLKINFNDNSKAQSRTGPPPTHTASYFWIGKSDAALAAKLSEYTKE